MTSAVPCVWPEPYYEDVSLMQRSDSCRQSTNGRKFVVDVIVDHSSILIKSTLANPTTVGARQLDAILCTSDSNVLV